MLPPATLPVAVIVDPELINPVASTAPPVVILPPATLPVAVMVVLAVIAPVTAAVDPSNVKFPLSSIAPAVPANTTRPLVKSLTIALASVASPVVLIVALSIAAAVVKLPPATLPVAVIVVEPAIAPEAVTVTVVTSPPVVKLPPVTLPVAVTIPEAVKLSPLATPIFGVVRLALTLTVTSSLTIAVVTSSTSTFNVSPVFDKPAPAVTIAPAPENCVQLIAVVPIVTGEFVVQTKPASSLSVPSSINVNAPGTSPLGVPLSKSVVLVSTKGVPASPTVDNW